MPSGEDIFLESGVRPKGFPLARLQPQFNVPVTQVLNIAQKLRDQLNLQERNFGATSNGSDWCIKALHPSDPITEVRGIPDESAIPSMFMNYQAVHTVRPNENATGTWQLDGQLIPNPFAFGSCNYTDSVGTHFKEFLNSQIPGSSHPERLNSFLSNFTRWRLAYASVTIYQDGPDLANQGTVVACQKPVAPLRMSISTSNLDGLYHASGGYHNLFHMEASDLPIFERSQAMPNSFFGRSREGLYLPLKLTRTCQNWKSARDLVYQCNAGSVTPYTSPSSGGILTIPWNPAAESLDVYPFLSLNDLHEAQSGTDVYMQGTLTSDFCNDNWGDFSFRNMAVTTSLSLFFRFGFEMQLQPQSQLSPHLKLSPQHDPMALESYFAISRELKDGYPADFNDLGKIWSVISSAAKTVAPFLAPIPVAGPLLATALPAVAKLGDMVKNKLTEKDKKRISGPTLGNTASAADVQKARAAVKAARRQAANQPALPQRAECPQAGRRRRRRQNN
jgi:hypothetical protein